MLRMYITVAYHDCDSLGVLSATGVESHVQLWVHKDARPSVRGIIVAYHDRDSLDVLSATVSSRTCSSGSTRTRARWWTSCVTVAYIS